MTKICRRRPWLAAGVAAMAFAGPAFAQTAPGPSDNLALNLMNLLVKQGVITQTAADGLLTEARRQTAEAQAQAPIATNPLPPPAAGATRIPYVPEIVKNQIREEVRQEVIQQAKAENWAQPNAVPEWTKRLQISGDLRLRYEGDFYSNINSPDIINFAAFNANGPVDVNSITNPRNLPLLNTRQDRINQLIIRARLDVLANPSDWVTADIRLASGSTNTPVSTSQLLGGGLTKKSFWLDRAYIDIHPASWVNGTFGRMPNPFFSTDLVYDTDLNFDGAALHGSYGLGAHQGFRLFATGGAFLTDYQDANFPTNSTSDQKAATKAKWLLGAQAGADWNTGLFDWKTGLAYYSFQGAQGQLSQPCALYTGITQCSTDFSRPAFMQKGNSLFYIRNVLVDPAKLDETPLPEFVGLVFPFHVLNLTSTLDMPMGGNRHLVLTGDYARNLAYKHSKICRYGDLSVPLNNLETPNPDITNVCAGLTGPTAPKLVSGPNAFMFSATYGQHDPFRWGEWNFTVGYKHLAADSVPDAYTDADFHLGGTNAKGYFVAATVGLAPNTNIQFRWFSSNEVSGPPMSIDVGQIDLNAKF